MEEYAQTLPVCKNTGGRSSAEYTRAAYVRLVRRCPAVNRSACQGLNGRFAGSPWRPGWQISSSIAAMGSLPHPNSDPKMTNLER
eukprot:6729807-Pyramimonas_sp.AAC.1